MVIKSIKKLEAELQFYKDAAIVMNELLSKHLREGLEESEEQPKRKKFKTFKERYQHDPEFRKKHLKYISAKIECPHCGFVTSRVYMKTHQKSRNCIIRKTKSESDKDV